MSEPEKKRTCFIAMPITTHEHEAERYNGDTEHWKHVMETIFVRAIEAAGFEPIRPVASGSHMIHGQIIKHLSTADMVLCDLSGHNPNVFFELGVRTSLNKPIALVRDEHTEIPFDTSGINTHRYSSTLHGWEVETQVDELTKHVQDCVESSGDSNPLWRHFGLTITAEKPVTGTSSSDAKIELIWESLNQLRRHMEGRPAPAATMAGAPLNVRLSAFAELASVVLGNIDFALTSHGASATARITFPVTGIDPENAKRIASHAGTFGLALELVAAEGSSTTLTVRDLYRTTAVG